MARSTFVGKEDVAKAVSSVIGEGEMGETSGENDAACGVRDRWWMGGVKASCSCSKGCSGEKHGAALRLVPSPSSPVGGPICSSFLFIPSFIASLGDVPEDASWGVVRVEFHRGPEVSRFAEGRSVPPVLHSATEGSARCETQEGFRKSISFWCVVLSLFFFWGGGWGNRSR